MRRMKWTPEEVTTLQKMWPVMSTAEVAERLGRPIGSVTGKAHELRLVRPERPERAPLPSNRDALGRFEATLGYLTGYHQAWGVYVRCTECGRRIREEDYIVQAHPTRGEQPEYRHVDCSKPRREAKGN